METTIRIPPFIEGRKGLLTQGKYEVTLNRTTHGESVEGMNVESNLSDEDYDFDISDPSDDDTDDDFFEDDGSDDDSHDHRFFFVSTLKDKKNLEEGLEETYVEDISREEIQSMTFEEIRAEALKAERSKRVRELCRQRTKLVAEALKALERGDEKRARELCRQRDKLVEAYWEAEGRVDHKRVRELCRQQDKLVAEALKAARRGDHAARRGDWKRVRELCRQQDKLVEAYLELCNERKEQERRIQEDAERIKKETETISQTPESDPQVLEAAEFVRNMTGDILEQKDNLQLKNTGLGKTSGVKKEHILSNTSVKETCRDVKIYLTKVAGLIEQKIHSLPENVRNQLDSLMTSFQKLLKGMWRLLVIVLILYELEKLIVSFKVDGAYISRKKGRLKYGFKMAAMLVLWLSHDVETNPGPASDRTTLEKVVRKMSEVLRYHLPVGGSLWSESVAEAAYAAGYSSDCNWTNPSGKNKDSASQLVARAAELGRLLASMECLPQDLAPFVFGLDKNEKLESLKTYDAIENYKKAANDLLKRDVNTVTAAQTDTIQQLTGQVNQKFKVVNQRHKLHLPGGLSESLPESDFAELADSNHLQFDDQRDQTTLCVSTAVVAGPENVLSDAGQNGGSGILFVHSLQLDNLAIENVESTDFSELLKYVDGPDKHMQNDITSKPSLQISQTLANSTTINSGSLTHKGNHTGVENECVLGSKYSQHNNENNVDKTESISLTRKSSKHICKTAARQRHHGNTRGDIASSHQVKYVCSQKNAMSCGITTEDKVSDDRSNKPKSHNTKQHCEVTNAEYPLSGSRAQVNDNSNSTYKCINQTESTQESNPVSQLNGNQDDTTDDVPTVSEANHLSVHETYNTDGLRMDKCINHLTPYPSDTLTGTGVATKNFATHTVADVSERIGGTEINTSNSSVHDATDASETIRRTRINTSNSFTHIVTDASETIRGTRINTTYSSTDTVTDASETIRGTRINTPNSSTHIATDASETIRGTRINTSNSVTHTETDASGGISGTGMDIPNSATHTVTDASREIRETGIDTSNSVTQTITDASERIRGTGIVTINSVMHTVTDASERIRDRGIHTSNSATHTITDVSERIGGTEINTISSSTHIVTDVSGGVRETGTDTSNSARHTITDASGGISRTGTESSNVATYTVTETSETIRETDDLERIRSRRTGIDIVNFATQTVTDEDSHGHTTLSVDEHASMSVKLSDNISQETPELDVQTLLDGCRYHKRSLKKLKSSIMEEVGHFIDRRLIHSSQSKEDANEDTKQRRITDFFTRTVPPVGMTHIGKRKLRHSDCQAKKRKNN